MIHQSSSRSTSSSSSSSCGSGKNAEPPAILNLTLYGSPAPRSVHRTSMGAIRARPRQKSIKPTTPPPSTPDLHLDLGSLAGSDSEYEGSTGTKNLPRLDASDQQTGSCLRCQHSSLASSTASSCHLSNRSSIRPPNQKSCRKVNHKSRVSQILFHNNTFERNSKFNSCTLKSFTPTVTENPHSLPFSEKNQHKQKYTAIKTSSQKSKSSSSRCIASDQESEIDSQEIACAQYKERAESNQSLSTLQSSTKRSNKDSTSSHSSYRAEKCSNFSKEGNDFQKELSSQTSFPYSPSRLQHVNEDKALFSENNKKFKEIPIDSGAESCFKVTEQNSLYQNIAEASASQTITRVALKEERSFQMLEKENKLLEEEYQNMSTSSYDITLSEVSPNNFELPSLNSENDLHRYDGCTKDLQFGKTSAHWFIPNDEGKRKHFSRPSFSEYHRNNSKDCPEDWEGNHVRIIETDSSNCFLARENSKNCTLISKYNYNRASEEPKEQEETLSSSQGSLGRERKNSDASWSSYHSSTYTTLSDSTWGCSSDTYESINSEEVCHGKISIDAMDESNSKTLRRNSLNSLKSETNGNATSKVVLQKQRDKDLEEKRASSDNEWSSDHFQREMRKNNLPSMNKCISRVESDKDSTCDEICPTKNVSGASQTRQSSSSGITGSITIDSNIDVHHSSPECLLQECNENENTHKVYSGDHETPLEARPFDEEEEEIISTATSDELCLLCSYSLKDCRCPPFPNTANGNSDDGHNQSVTESSNSSPSFVRNVCSAPECNSEYERRTNLLLQRLGCSTTAPDVLLSADEVMEAAMYARQLVHVLEQALDRALSLKMTSVSEIASQSNLRRSQSVPEFSSKRSLTYEDRIPFSTEGSSPNTVHIAKSDKMHESITQYNIRQEDAGLREGFTNSGLFSLNKETQNDEKKNMVKRMNICQEKCYCCGPKLLNVSPQELQQQRALLKPVDKKPQAFSIMKDMASILKNVISHRRDIIVPPEDGAYYVSRSVSEWSIDE